MVKCLKYCLEGIVILGCISCGPDRSEIAPVIDRPLAEEIFKSGEQVLQGSPECMHIIEKAIAADSTYAEAIRELSVPYLKRGMPQHWKPIYDRAVRHDAKTWQPWRGYLYLWFYRDYRNAIADFNASDTLTPNFIDQPQGHSVDYWRGIAYLGLQDYDTSIAYWDRHIQKETEETGEDWVEINAFLYRGIAYYESGNPENAMEDFQKILQYFKRSADAKYYRAKILLENGEHAAAREALDAAFMDFDAGFVNERDYVETLRQLYRSDLVALRKNFIR